MSIIKAEIVRKAGHPWDGSKRPNFDMLYVDSTSRSSLDLALAIAEQLYWRTWISGPTDDPGLFSAVLFKPSGIKCDWDDGLDNPHPGNSQVTDESEVQAILNIG